MITPIPLLILSLPTISLSFFLSLKSIIFLDIPPPLLVLGINTQYFPANDNRVVTAAPLLPLSSFTT